MAKNPTQTLRDHSINIIVQNKVLFGYTGKRFANKINQYPIIASFPTFIIINGIPCYRMRVANTDTNSNPSLARMALSNYKAATYTFELTQ